VRHMAELSPLAKLNRWRQKHKIDPVNADQQLILEQVCTIRERFDVDTVFALVSKITNRTRIRLAVVYRFLIELVKAGMLRQFTHQGTMYFEHELAEPHCDHLFCRRCRKMIRLDDAILKVLREELAERHKFRAQDHRLIIGGLCERCAKAWDHGKFMAECQGLKWSSD
jgi:Fur family transcriptional regulator, ferric uptake regulator